MALIFSFCLLFAQVFFFFLYKNMACIRKRIPKRKKVTVVLGSHSSMWLLLQLIVCMHLLLLHLGDMDVIPFVLSSP